ncbi:MAG: LiaI-LiaF-like domain-containing protein [Terriglobia bacterium]
MNERTPRRARSGFALPIILIMLGVLFLLNEYAPRLSLARTWPAIPIIAGILLLTHSFAPLRPPRGPKV